MKQADWFLTADNGALPKGNACFRDGWVLKIGRQLEGRLGTCGPPSIFREGQARFPQLFGLLSSGMGADGEVQ